jgi:hypothetical protein
MDHLPSGVKLNLQVQVWRLQLHLVLPADAQEKENDYAMLSGNVFPDGIPRYWV